MGLKLSLVKNSEILITGFKPFLGQSMNPSEILVKRFESLGYSGLVLPVEFSNCLRPLIETVQRQRPRFVLMLGQASGRTAVCLEQVALNFLDSQYPDNQGVLRQNEKINPTGPEAYISSLPLRDWANDVNKSGAPCSRSLTAGSYVCNFLYYQFNHWLEQNSAMGLKNRNLFIHIPLTPEQEGDASITRLSLNDSQAAIAVILNKVQRLVESGGSN
jgi:pyroglutamyl-peptidase